MTTQPCDRPEFLAGRGAEVRINGQLLGWIGELSRELLEACDLQDAVCVAELRLPLLESLYQSHRGYTPLPRFPSISRDLNFVLPESVSWAELASVVSQSAGTLLTGTSFSGQYRGKQIEADRKSYVITCRFMAPDRTLTTDEVDAAVHLGFLPGPPRTGYASTLGRLPPHWSFSSLIPAQDLLIARRPRAPSC